MSQQSTEAAGAAITSLAPHPASTKRPLVCVVQWCRCSVCLYMLFVQTWEQCLHSFNGAAIVMYTCTYGTHYIRRRGVNEPGRPSLLRKRIWVVFTVWIIHSLHCIVPYQAYTQCAQCEHTPTSAHKKKKSKNLFMQKFSAFVNEWTSSLLCKYHRCAHPAEIFHQEINCRAFMWNKREVSNKKHRTNKQHREVSNQQV